MISSFLLLLFLVSSTRASDPATPAYSVLSRALPEHLSGLFNLTIVTNEEGSWFSHKSSGNGGTVNVQGSTPVALAAGAIDWLKENAQVSISWQATGGDSFPSVPFVAPATVGTSKASPYDHVYYNNVCTYGYSGMWWWDFDRWEHEIDRMALNGVTSPLLVLGQEFVWNQVWSELGLTQDEIDSWNAGPAYQAWFYMGNLQSFGGPISQSYMERTKDLQIKILERVRSLGMTPILPSFGGFVPEAFSTRHPDADVKHTDGGWGGDFAPVAYLDPTSSHFLDISRSFVTKYCSIFTCNTESPNYYAADLYNELSPPSNDLDYLSSASSAVYSALESVDKNAIWVTQGWMFFSAADFWQLDEIEAFVKGPPSSKLIVIDLFAEVDPIWESSSSFFDTPFIFSTIFNFGGRSGIYGMPQNITDGITTSLNAPNSMVGIGAAPEAIETNPVDYDFLWDHIYNTDHHNVTSFIQNYASRRYKTDSETASEALHSAWSLLERSAYSNKVATEGATSSIFILRPVFNATQAGCCAVLDIYYDTRDMIDALRFLLSAGDESDELAEQSTYRFDTINVAVQAVSNEAMRVYHLMNKADGVRDNMDYFLQLLDLTDELLQDQPERMLGFWIEKARLAASEEGDAQKDFMEWNARTIVTIWGDTGSSLNEYSYRLWAGLLSTFYRKRWEQFFNAVLDLEQTFDQDVFTSSIKEWEFEWTQLTTKDVTLPSKPNGNGLELAKKAYELLK